jgi:hypothetical protein
LIGVEKREKVGKVAVRVADRVEREAQGCWRRVGYQHQNWP